MLNHARHLASQGQDEAAKAAYLALLHADPADLTVLTELGALARAGGHLAAARTAYEMAARCHPQHPMARVNFGRALLDDGEIEAARAEFAAAGDYAPAHQGLARVYFALGEPALAEAHLRLGYAGHASVVRPYRGVGTPKRLLLLVSAREGNIPLSHWELERRFETTAIYTDFWDPSAALPPHDLVLNAIGDADLCGAALDAAGALLAGTSARVINAPACVRQTGRAANAARLGALPGVVAPIMWDVSSADLSVLRGAAFPLLLRVPGQHMGRAFIQVESADALPEAAASLGAARLLAIEYLDARGADGMARKYRVMIVDGVILPVHLAISPDWKVHYFSAAMAGEAAFRAEENRFLLDMPGTLGPRAMAALAGIGRALGLAYCGVDFARAADGSVLLFEANATMVACPPPQGEMWDYRRAAATRVADAVDRLLTE